MTTRGRALKHVWKCVAILLIYVCVVLLQVCPQVSSMMVELKHIREKREAINTTARTTDSTTSNPITSNPTTTDSTTSNPTTTNPTTTYSTTSNPTTTDPTTTTPTTTNPTTSHPRTSDSTTTNPTTSDSTTTNPTTTDSTTSDSTTTDSTTTNPRTTDSTTTNPTTTNPTTTDSTTLTPTITNPTTSDSTTTNPTTSDSTTTNPTTSDSTATNPTTTDSTTTNPATTDSTTTNPTTTDSTTTNPTTTDSTTTNPTTTNPTTTDSTTLTPTITNPTTSDFTATNPTTTDSTTANPTTTDSTTTNPTTTDSTTTNPATADSTTANPTTTDSTTTNPTTTDSTTTNPATADSTTTDPTTTDSTSTNSTTTDFITTDFTNTAATTTNPTTPNSADKAEQTIDSTNSKGKDFMNTADTTRKSTTTTSTITAAPTTISENKDAPIAVLQTEYLVEIEIDTINIAAFNLVKKILKTPSFPVINSNTNITEINITTVCTLNGDEYQCRCEDQYSWPYEKCARYESCDHITDDLCHCISAIPDDGHFCQPISELDITEYLVNIEIDTINIEALYLPRNILETFSLPIINSNSIITEINITTVCSSNGTGYQCRCEDQYFWPYDKCIVHGSCDCNTNSSCGCINAIPNDGPFCQPISESNELITNTAAATTCSTSAPNTTETHVVTFALKINEVFDFGLTNKQNEKYTRYSTLIKDSIDKGYSSVSVYRKGSAFVSGFRSGSVIADFDIHATSGNPDLLTANQQVIASLREQGFNVSDDAVSRTVKDGLYTSTNLIYPEKNLTLNCSTANGSITWMKNGKEIVPAAKYSVEKTVLVVINVDSIDSGIYECQTTFNSMPIIIWQSIVIPYVQVNSSKEISCRNLKVTLQCCGHPSYKVKWGEGCSSKVEQTYGCIYCEYSINENECQARNQSRTVTCTLDESNYSKSIIIDAVNKAFTCSDNGSNAAFGAGEEGQNKTGDCNGDMIGYQIAQCKASGDWIVTYDNCVLRDIKYLEDISQTLSVMDLPQFAQNLSTAVVANAPDITKSPATIITIVELLKTIAKLSQSINVNEDIMTDVLKTLDVIGSDSAKDAWLLLNKNSTTMKTSSELLKSIEDIAHRLQDKSFDITTNYTSLKKHPNITTSFNKTFGKELTTQINIPGTSGKKSLTVIISSVLNNILPVRNLTYNDSSKTNTSINGDVAVLDIQPTINNISLTFTIKNNTLGNPQCVFWNFGLMNGVGGWDSTGCQLKILGNEADRYTCECNHTTSFSILMSPFSLYPFVILDYITYIGVAISLASLVLCLIIEFIIWKSVTRSVTSYIRHVSIVNIAISLLIANICFIIGAAVVRQGDGPCSTATFFMHFFYLALFFWMLLSALFLLYCVLMVLSRPSRTTMTAIAFTVGYGAPLLIAVITVASTAGKHGYIQTNYNCWLNWNETKALLAFVIPALTIVAINLLVLIVVLCKILRREVKASTQPEEKHPLLVITRCVAIFTPLFGLTWGFGIGTLVSSDPGIHIVFAFLNSLQGFFILVFGTLLDKKVREALAGKLALANISSNRTRSTNDGPSSSGGFPVIQMLRKRDANNISEGRVLAK